MEMEIGGGVEYYTFSLTVFSCCVENGLERSQQCPLLFN